MIADAPATAITNTAVLNGNMKGNMNIVVAKIAAATATIMINILMSTTFLFAAKPRGQR